MTYRIIIEPTAERGIREWEVKKRELAERLETIRAVRESLASADRGEGRPMDDVFDEPKQGPPSSRRTGSVLRYAPPARTPRARSGGFRSRQRVASSSQDTSAGGVRCQRNGSSEVRFARRRIFETRLRKPVAG